MKLERSLFFFAIALLLSACIKSEAPNAEADILSCKIEEAHILKTAPIINNSTKGKYSVTFLVKEPEQMQAITPYFELTAGASIEPQDGITQDFTRPITYTVTSEDGQWTKKYSIAAIQTNIPKKYSFETVSEKSTQFHTFVERIDGIEVMEWASGNSGYLSAPVPKDKPEDFPTYKYPYGHTNECAKLVTRSTGSLAGILKKPIAAGNLFIGSFDPANAMTDPLSTTLFGLPFNEQPLALKGYYKYKPGEKLIDKNSKVIEGEIDSGDIYAVFYESDDNDFTLNGSNSLTHPNIVSIARVENVNETPKDQWVSFEVPFKLLEGKEINPEKLDQYRYKLAIVFTSSKDGAHFKGAVGSTLLIDDVELLSEPINVEDK